MKKAGGLPAFVAFQETRFLEETGFLLAVS